MAKTRVVINSRTSGKYSFRTSNGREHLVVSMIPIVGDSVMNGIFYPDAEVGKSFPQLNNLPAPDSHPTVDGVDVSAFHPLAINAHNVGGFVKNPVKDGQRVNAELWIDTQVAERSGRGTQIMEAIKNRSKVGVSTGLFMEPTIGTGNIGGDNFDMTAKNIDFDHVAILLDERPAGKETFLLNKGLESECTVYACNVAQDVEEEEEKTEPIIETNTEEKTMELQEMIDAINATDSHRAIDIASHTEFTAFKANKEAAEMETRNALAKKSGMEIEHVAAMPMSAVNTLLAKLEADEKEAAEKLEATNKEHEAELAKAKAVKVDNSLRAGSGDPAPDNKESDIAKAMGLGGLV